MDTKKSEEFDRTYLLDEYDMKTLYFKYFNWAVICKYLQLQINFAQFVIISM